VTRPHLICFAGDVWDGNPHSRHHLMNRLRADYDVLFVEGVPMRRAVLERHELRRIMAKLRRARQLRTVAPGLHVLRTLPVPPLGRAGRRAQLVLLRSEIEHAARKLHLDGSRLLWFSHPLVSPLLGRLGESGSIFYYQDRYDAFNNVDAPRLRRHVGLLATGCDASVATSEALAEDLRQFGAEPVLLPHGVDLDRFASEQPVPADLLALERPLIGFVGLIDTHLDLEAILAIAEALDRGSVAIVGGTNIDTRHLRHPRIMLLGSRAYSEIPAYLQAFDVCILPFRQDRLNEAVNPIKLREYLAAGRPTVSTPLPAVLPYASGVELARGAAEFPAAVLDALRPGVDSTSARERRRQLVAGESWDAVAARVQTVLGGLLTNASSPG
jgi:glycosyltransferase involved in cell wall biosynthesis